MYIGPPREILGSVEVSLTYQEPLTRAHSSGVTEKTPMNFLEAYKRTKYLLHPETAVSTHEIKRPFLVYFSIWCLENYRKILVVCTVFFLRKTFISVHSASISPCSKSNLICMIKICIYESTWFSGR